MFPKTLDVNARRSSQQRPALGGEGGQGAALVTLDDPALHEAPALELIDGPGDAAGREIFQYPDAEASA